MFRDTQERIISQSLQVRLTDAAVPEMLPHFLTPHSRLFWLKCFMTNPREHIISPLTYFL